MTDTNTIDVGDAVNIALRGIRAQLTSAQELATGPARNVIANLLDEQGLLTVHFNSILEVANRDADEFNALALELEDRDTRINKLELRAASLVDQLRKAELTASEAEAAAAEARTALTAVDARLALEQQHHRKLVEDARVLARELKAERAGKADIERLKKQAKSRQAELEELRAGHAKLRGELARNRKDKAGTEQRLAELVKVSSQQEEYIKDLTRRLTYNDGDVVNQIFTGEDGVLWYFYSFGWGLKCQQADRELIHTDWHIELRTNTGIGVLVMIDDNLEPVIPLTEQTGQVPRELITVLKATIVERCKESHPALYARRLWARETPVSTLGFTPQLLRKLTDNRLHTAFDLLAHTPQKLARLKGIGSKTATVIDATAQAAARAWQKDYQHTQRKADQAA